MRTPPFLLLALLACACAPKPVLYPNQRYKDAGPAQVKADIGDCRAKAKEFLASHKAEIVAKHVTFGAAAGAAIGMVAAAFTGDIGRAVAEGAAIGGASGAIRGGVEANSPDAIERRFIDMCLADKGYEPIGWR